VDAVSPSDGARSPARLWISPASAPSLNLLAGLDQAFPHRERLGGRLESLSRKLLSRLLRRRRVQPERAHALDHVADVGRTMTLDLQLRVFLAQERQLRFELAHGEHVPGGGRSVGYAHAQEPAERGPASLCLDRRGFHA
jgi:hypothetical protein